jgi:hypothetical protein
MGTDGLDDAVEAYAPVLDSTDREALTEEGQMRAFLRSLRAERNAALVRDGMISTIIGGLLTIVVALGPSRQPAPEAHAASASDFEAAPSATSSAASPGPVDHVDGSLKEEDLARALAAQKDEIARCFELANAPSDDASTVTVAFLVSEKGKVLDVADVGSTVPDRTVVHCVARSMRSLSLPAPADGKSSVVRHAFRPPRGR